VKRRETAGKGEEVRQETRSLYTSFDATRTNIAGRYGVYEKSSKEDIEALKRVKSAVRVSDFLLG
jgi:hypothetical protein